MDLNSQRYYSFDALRAMMMLLGLVLHVVISYTTYTEGFFAGFFKDAFTSKVCDILLWWIHLFRMPVFFVMAGFFAALVYQRKGKKEFWKNRLRRIVSAYCRLGSFDAYFAIDFQIYKTRSCFRN